MYRAEVRALQPAGNPGANVLAIVKAWRARVTSPRPVSGLGLAATAPSMGLSL
jgi:hypothetical protein